MNINEYYFVKFDIGGNTYRVVYPKDTGIPPQTIEDALASYIYSEEDDDMSDNLNDVEVAVPFIMNSFEALKNNWERIEDDYEVWFE